MKFSLLTLIKESKKYLISIVPLILLSSFFGVYPMKLIQQIVDIAILQDVSKINLILRFGFFYIACFLLWSASLYFQNVIVRKAEVEKGHEIRSKLFNHIMFIPQKFFTDNKSGDIAADLLKDSEITTSEFLKPVVYMLQVRGRKPSDYEGQQDRCRPKHKHKYCCLIRNFYSFGNRFLSIVT